jgi:hypothetical protein
MLYSISVRCSLPLGLLYSVFLINFLLNLYCFLVQTIHESKFKMIFLPIIYLFNKHEHCMKEEDRIKVF